MRLDGLWEVGNTDHRWVERKRLLHRDNGRHKCFSREFVFCSFSTCH